MLWKWCTLAAPLTPAIHETYILSFHPLFLRSAGTPRARQFDPVRLSVSESLNYSSPRVLSLLLYRTLNSFTSENNSMNF